MFAHSNVDKASDVDDLIQTFSLFSGADVRCQSPNFKGGNVTSIFGGIEIDMREATLSSEGAALDLLTIFGGVTITVPKDVRVERSEERRVGKEDRYGGGVCNRRIKV